MVTATSAISAGHLRCSSKMMSAHTPIAFTIDSSTIFAARPTGPEKNATARDGSANAVVDSDALGGWVAAVVVRVVPRGRDDGGRPGDRSARDQSFGSFR